MSNYKKLRTDKNYQKAENFLNAGCSTSLIAKFMNLSYNQAWYLCRDIKNKKEKQALNSKNITSMISEKSNEVKEMKRLTTKRRKDSTTSVQKKINIKPENVKLTNDGKNITITINLAI